jgi:hypothetical protein
MLIIDDAATKRIQNPPGEVQQENPAGLAVKSFR